MSRWITLNTLETGVNINANNAMHNKINLRKEAIHRGYSPMNRMFKSRLISKESKIKLPLILVQTLCMDVKLKHGQQQKVTR